MTLTHALLASLLVALAAGFSPGSQLPACGRATSRRALSPLCCAADAAGADENPTAEEEAKADAAVPEASDAKAAKKAEKAKLKEEKAALRARIAELEPALTAARGAKIAAEEAAKDAGENGYMLLAANMERMRETARMELKNQKGYGKVAAVRPLLDFIEHFDDLQAERGSDADVDDIHKFYEGIQKQTATLLEGWQVKDFTVAAGDTFDRVKHQQVKGVFSDEVPSGKVIESEGRGWMMGSDVLRPAKCVVSKGPEPAEPPPAEEAAEEAAAAEEAEEDAADA